MTKTDDLRAVNMATLDCIDSDNAISFWLGKERSVRRTEALSYLYFKKQDRDAERALIEREVEHCHRSSWLIDRYYRFHAERDPDYRWRPKLSQSLQVTHDQRVALDRTIFITGGDANFFSWIVECVASFRAHDAFASIPIGIIDCGLLDKQKAELVSRFAPLTLVDPGFDFAEHGDMAASWKCGIPDGEQGAFKAITSRAYLDRHFPGHDYYFWCDADAWVQDPATIIRFVDLAREQSIGMTENNHAVLCKDTMFFHRKYMTRPMLKLLKGKKLATCAGVICLTPDFMAHWREIVEELFERKGIVNNSPSLWYAIHKLLDDPAFLPHSQQFFFKREGLPLVDERQILYAPDTREPCGIIHLNGFYRIRDNFRFLQGLSFEHGKVSRKHAKRSWKALSALQADPSDPLPADCFPGQAPFAFRYSLTDPDPQALAERTVLANFRHGSN